MGLINSYYAQLLKAQNFNVLLRHTRQTGFALTLSTSNASTLKWGDGTQSTITSGNVVTYTHDYASSGTWEVEVTDALNDVARLQVPSMQVTYLDARRLNNLSELVEFHSNPITEAIFGTGTGVITRFWGYNNTSQTRVDASGLSGFGGNVQMQGCTALTEFLLPANTVQPVTLYYINGCTALQSHDMSGLKGGVTGFFLCNGCTALSNLALAPSYTGGRFWASNCLLNRSFPLGTVILCPDIRLQDNGMSQANVNATIDNLYQNRGAFVTTAKTLQIGGSNAAPSGTALTQIADLRANHNWTITHS